MPNSEQEMRERAAKLMARLHPIDYDFNVRTVAKFALLERAEARREAIAESIHDVKAVGIEELKAAGLGYVIANDASAVLTFVVNRLRAKLTPAPEKPKFQHGNECGLSGCNCPPESAAAPEAEKGKVNG